MHTISDDAYAELMRYRWLKGRYRGADFNYGVEGDQVLLFDFPDCAVSNDLDATIDRATMRSECQREGTSE